MMDWRLANSLVQFRSELDTSYPHRDRTSDGSIGDLKHQQTNSDHNPRIKDHRGQPIVAAIDIDRDIALGFTSRDLAERLRIRRDQRIKYVISKGQMFASYANESRKAWEWGPYTGTNSHTEHMHISVAAVESLFDSVTPWGIATALAIPVPTIAPPPKLIVVPPLAAPPVTVALGGHPTLRLGSAGEDVRYLQRMLGRLNDDGDFGPKTRDRVRSFQGRAGLDQTGIMDPTTWAALEA